MQLSKWIWDCHHHIVSRWLDSALSCTSWSKFGHSILFTDDSWDWKSKLVKSPKSFFFSGWCWWITAVLVINCKHFSSYFSTNYNHLFGQIKYCRNSSLSTVVFCVLNSRLPASPMLQVLTTLTKQMVSADYDTVRVPDGALCNPPFTFVFTIMNIYRVPYGNSQL